MKKTLVTCLLAFAGLALSARGDIVLVTTTYTADTTMANEKHNLVASTATWTINPGVTVTGGSNVRLYLGSTTLPNDIPAIFIVDGGGTLNLTRNATWGMRLGDFGGSEAGILIIKDGSKVLMTGETANVMGENPGSYITLDGLGSTFQWIGTWDAVNNKVVSQSANRPAPLNVTGGILQITPAGIYTIATVIDVADPAPPEWITNPFDGAPGVVSRAYSDTLANKAFDPNGDPITFSLIDTGTWLNVATDGALTNNRTLVVGDIGTHSFQVVADDGITGSSTGTLSIVVRDSLSPVWDVDLPIDGGVVVINGNYVGSLAGKAHDPDGAEIIYAKTGGDDWLTVDADGTMSGVAPAVAGTNTFTVSADDGIDAATPAEMFIVVTLPPEVAIIETTTYTADTTLDDEKYYLEATHATWTINPGVTVTGTNSTRLYIGTKTDPDDVPAIFTVDGGGTLNMTRNGTYGLRLGESNQSEAGVLIVKGGSKVLMTGETANVLQQNGGGSYITLDGDGSTFQWIGTWDADNDKVVSQNAGNNATPLSVTNGTLQISTNGIYTTATVLGSDPVAVEDLAISGPVAGGMVLSWTGESRWSYIVETNSNLIVGNWQPFTTVSGKDGANTVTNLIGPDQTFYRVISE